MIRAVDALRLPTAQLTPEQLASADKLEAEIEEAVNAHFQFQGIDMKCTETDPNVVAAVNRRLRAAGYAPTWTAIFEQHKLNQALRTHVGFGLSMMPSHDAYDEFEKSKLS